MPRSTTCPDPRSFLKDTYLWRCACFVSSLFTKVWNLIFLSPKWALKHLLESPTLEHIYAKEPLVISNYFKIGFIEDPEGQNDWLVKTKISINESKVLHGNSSFSKLKVIFRVNPKNFGHTQELHKLIPSSLPFAYFRLPYLYIWYPLQPCPLTSSPGKSFQLPV